MHGYPAVVSAWCCQVRVSATVRSLVQRSPTEYGMPEYNPGISQRMPRPTKIVEPWKRIGITASIKTKLYEVWFHNDNLYDLCSTPNSSAVVESRRTRRTSAWYVWVRRERNTDFWYGDLKEWDHLEDIGVDRKIILKGTLVRRKSVDWINLADDMYKWWAVGNTVMNIRFS